jgi:hypothetical protein
MRQMESIRQSHITQQANWERMEVALHQRLSVFSIINILLVVYI